MPESSLNDAKQIHFGHLQQAAPRRQKQASMNMPTL